MDQDLSLEWYKSHPYVEAWRSTDSHSFFPAVAELNYTLDVDPNHPITIGRVEKIVTAYLKLLCRDIKKELSGKKLSPDELSQKFSLNRVETLLVHNSIKKQIQF